MTSISAASANTYQSPLQQLQAELQSQVTSGAISSSDQKALSSALTDIDSSIQSGGSSDQSSGGKPGDVKSKIDDLISKEVSSGKLTSDQATELKSVFKAAFANGPGGAGGPPPRRSAPRRIEVRRLVVLGFVELEHQFGQRPAEAIAAIAAGCHQQFVFDLLQLERQHQLIEQQLVALGAADRLPELTFS
jgi:hypothetical protein